MCNFLNMSMEKPSFNPHNPEYKKNENLQEKTQEIEEYQLSQEDKENGKEKFDEKIFFENTWPNLLCAESKSIDLTGIDNPQERAEILYSNVIPSLDAYIKKFSLPIIKKNEETDEAFFTRICSAMDNLNSENKEKESWRDTWPSTAIEIGRTNCSLGSLVLGRALELAGYDRDEIEFGLPGLGSHAVIIIKNKYIDQANGVVVDVVKDTEVDGIKTYQVQVPDEADEKLMMLLPFRRIPVCTLEQGVNGLITNLGSMRSRLKKTDTPPEEMETAQDLNKRFKLNKTQPYSDWGRENLLPKNWNVERMEKHDAWKNELTEVSARFRSFTSLGSF